MSDGSDPNTPAPLAGAARPAEAWRVDPFGVTADPRLYVPRLATEDALAELRSAFAAGGRLSVLSGPPGLGKTLILHVLAEQLAEHARCVHLPYAALPMDELAHWALARLGETPQPGVAFPDALAGVALREAAAGRSLLLLMDDASALPVQAARDLCKLVAQLEGAIGVIVVLADDRRAGRVLAALGEGVQRVRLRHGLGDEEARSYLRARCARAGAGAGHALAAFTSERVDWLIAESAGNPRRLNALATWLLHRAGTAPGEFPPPSEDEVLWLDVEPLVPAEVADLPEPDAPEAPTDAPAPAPRRRRSSMMRRRARRAGRTW